MEKLWSWMLAVVLGAYVNLCACPETLQTRTPAPRPQSHPCCPHESPVAPDQAPGSPSPCHCQHGGTVAQPETAPALEFSFLDSFAGIPTFDVPAPGAFAPEVAAGHPLWDPVRPPGSLPLFLANGALLL